MHTHTVHVFFACGVGGCLRLRSKSRDSICRHKKFTNEIARAFVTIVLYIFLMYIVI
jgi:hypothetical protein